MRGVQRSVGVAISLLAMSAQVMAATLVAAADDHANLPGQSEALAHRSCEVGIGYGAKSENPDPSGSTGSGEESADCD